MKNIYITILLLCAYLGQAQTKETIDADKLYNRYEYVKAVAAYQKLADNGKGGNYVIKQLGDAYYNMFNPTESVKWYALLVQTDQDAETYYRYAQMLKSLGKYEESNAQMKIFAQKMPSDSRSVAFLSTPNFSTQLLTKEKKFNVESLSVNSDKTDFAPIADHKVLYFVSARNNSRRDYGWTKEPFLDIYRSDINDDGTVTNPLPVGDLNNKRHDGPISITGDGRKVYFTSDSFRDKEFIKDKKNNVQLGRNHLYVAQKDGTAFTNIKALPFNNNDYSFSNPSVTRDGKTLYFTSNMPGGLGGIDIWKIAINGDGTYGTPENLGSKVNSEGTESFPFIADDNVTLYFASSGKQGLGGLDVFKINLAKDKTATNLGSPVNTEKDDFSFSFNEKSNVGYFASNRNGNDDLFRAIPVCGVDLIAKITDAKTGKILADAKVSIVDEKKNVVATEMSDNDGHAKFRLDCDKDFSVQASKGGYDSAIATLDKAKNGEKKLGIALQPIEVIITPEKVVLNDIYFEYDKSNVTESGAAELDRLVQVLIKNPEMVLLVKAHTDNRGSDTYNMLLSDKRAKACVQYVISKGISENRITGKGMGESEPLVDCKENCTEDDFSKNRRCEFLIVK
ncbi:MAG: cell envelope biogenesis protein OmpA [Flavobacterium sp. BFFFF2]|nr:MAG: cell envelope biogenesis protein OmpA [Flavobacterium sp. BFFFF2]